MISLFSLTCIFLFAIIVNGSYKFVCIFSALNCTQTKGNRMAYTVPSNASWLISLPPAIYNDSNFQKIINFFVVHSFVEDTSSRGKSIDKDYHWNNPWKKPYHLRRQLINLSSNKSLLYSASVYDHKSNSKAETLEEALIKADLIVFPRYDKEVACIYNSKEKQILSLFTHIRNSFAHCRFNIIDNEHGRVYCFEDGITVNKSMHLFKVSSRIVLFESTLLKWIDLIESGEKEYIKL